MIPLGDDEQPRREGQPINPLSARLPMLSLFISFVTLCAVLYSFYAIPLNVEQRRAGRMEELRAMTDLVDEVDDLTKSVVELMNARTNSGRNPR